MNEQTWQQIKRKEFQLEKLSKILNAIPQDKLERASQLSQPLHHTTPTSHASKPLGPQIFINIDNDDLFTISSINDCKRTISIQKAFPDSKIMWAGVPSHFTNNILHKLISDGHDITTLIIPIFALVKSIEKDNNNMINLVALTTAMNNADHLIEFENVATILEWPSELNKPNTLISSVNVAINTNEELVISINQSMHYYRMLSAQLKEQETSETTNSSSSSSTVEIKARRPSFNAPTPANTPLNSAPITSKQFKSTLAAMSDNRPGKTANSINAILSQNPQILTALQGRLGELVGTSSGYIESLPEPVKQRIAVLESLQTECHKLTREFDREVAALEKKYESLYKPLYKKRADIANGDVEPLEHPEEPKGIPEFWLTIMKNSPVLQDLIFECDEDVLTKLKDIRCILLEDNPGFRLEFEFDENEYFSNQVLTKTYYLEETEEDTEVMFDHAEGTTIQWKTGKNLTVATEIRKQRHKQSKQTRIVKKTVPQESFFKFFTPPQLPPDEEEDDEEEEEEEDEETDSLQEAVQMDYEIGEHFKESIIPEAIDWFTGKAAEDWEDEDEEDDYDSYEDEDEEDDEDDDEESDEDERSPVKTTNPPPSTGNNPQNPECKQQ